MSKRVGQRAQDSPILARITGRKRRPVGQLHAALGVHVDPGFFRVGGARKDHIGTMCAAVAVSPDIDNERTGRDVDLVGAEQEQHIKAARRHLCRV